jgi:hypothetical protein
MIMPKYSQLSLSALTSKLGQINVRRLILNGQREEIRRYIVYGFERAVLNMAKVSNETGKEYIEGHLLFNMAGYNLRTHSCIQCELRNSLFHIINQYRFNNEDLFLN